MSGFDPILKDIGSLHSMVLDHSYMTQREIKLFLKEFEQRRNEREVQNLSQSLELATVAETALLPDCLELAAQHLASIQEKLYECEAIFRESEDREFEKKRIRTASQSEPPASTHASSAGTTSGLDSPAAAGQLQMLSSTQLP